MSKDKSRTKRGGKSGKDGGGKKRAGRKDAGLAAPLLLEDARPTLPPDRNLLEQSRTQWLFGDWAALAALTPDRIAPHPDRARLALLAAAGLAQLGETVAAATLLRLARGWGCDSRLVARVMVSGLHNAMGRAAGLLDRPDLARGHFDTAIGLGAPGGDIRLLARARQASQTAGTAARISRSLAADTPAAGLPAPPAVTANPQFSAPAFAYYRQAAGQMAAPGFLFVDVKSLPRSGLHYFKGACEGVLGRQFSFCEWYQEPGCCRKMPCVLTGYAAAALARPQAGMRMVKSHDFALTDPAYPTNPMLRRIILVRDPLFVLTSWWCLDMIEAHKGPLKERDLITTKIYYAHDSTMLAAVYRVVDEVFQPPGPEALAAWLAKRKTYITGFLRKWLPAAGRPAPAFQHVVPYEAVPEMTLGLLTDLRDGFPPDVAARFAQYLQGRTQGFVARADPFTAPAPRLARYLQDHAAAFRATAAEIVETIGPVPFGLPPAH